MVQRHQSLFNTIMIMTLLMVSCNRHYSERSNSNANTTRLGNKVVSNAMHYKGTPYQYGGLNKDGLDCSGLVYVSYKEAGVIVPRSTAELTNKVLPISLRDVRAGDLLFFKTDKKDTNKISHVGIVVKRNSNDDIVFIHAASLGVKEDNLNQEYYQKTFAKAGRIK